MAVLLGAVLEALVWACDRDTDGQAVADLPTFEPVCQIHARKGSSVRQGPCANAAPATPRQAPLRPGQPRGVDAPTGLARPREVAAAVCESIEHLTLVITAARAADAAAPAPLPGHHSEPIALRQAVRAVLRALSDRLRWDKGFPLTGVDLALAVSPWVPSVAAEMLPGVLTAAWGSSATAAGRLWPLFSALNLSERPLTPRAR